MAAPLEVPWAQIRRDWEGTLKGDAELAAQYGFASKTTIARRRIKDGWKRDERGINAEVTARALGPARADVSAPVDVSAGHTPDTPGTHAESQQSLGSEAGPGLGVSAEKGANTSVSVSARRFAAARDDNPVEDWLEIKAEAKRRHLRITREVQDANLKVVRALSGIMDGPQLGGIEAGDDYESPNTPYGLAVIAVRAVNADRETHAGLLKTATDGLDKSIKLERTLLGMDEPDHSGKPGAALPAGIMSEEQFLQHYQGSLESLELLANLASELHRNGGRVVDAEIIPQPEEP